MNTDLEMEIEAKTEHQKVKVPKLPQNKVPHLYPCESVFIRG